MAEAGEEVLTAAAEGDPEKIITTAQRQLAAIREAGWVEVVRLMPPGLDNHEEE
jgi:hypothetical protein